MARAKITYTYNPQNGERDYHIEYESEQPIHLHERKHRELVREIVGLGVDDADDGQLDVDRGEADGDAPAADLEPEAEQLPARAKAEKEPQ